MVGTPAGGGAGSRARRQSQKWIAKLDAFPRTEDHLRQQTPTGAVVSLIGITMMAVLFFHELSFYLKTYVEQEMSVDVTRNTKLPIHINITFPSLPCSVLSLDALDMSGKHEVDLDVGISKDRLDQWGNHLDSEHVTDLTGSDHNDTHAEKALVKGGGLTFMDYNQQLRDAVEQVRTIQTSLERHEGCRVVGKLEVERVAGNFHISVHGQSFYVLQKLFTEAKQVNVSHIIHSMSFGVDYPGIINPLDGFVRVLGTGDLPESGTFKYFLKVVPTEYRHLGRGVVPTNQFSVTEYFMPSRGGDGSLPAVYFLYDLSPIAVKVTEKRRSFVHFLVRLSAVLGGTFALTGLLDKWIHRLLKAVMPSIA